MAGIFLTLILLAVFVFLFFRQDRMDMRAERRRELEADIHMLKEMKRFLISKSEDARRFEEALRASNK